MEAQFSPSHSLPQLAVPQFSMSPGKRGAGNMSSSHLLNVQGSQLSKDLQPRLKPGAFTNPGALNSLEPSDNSTQPPPAHSPPLQVGDFQTEVLRLLFHDTSVAAAWEDGPNNPCSPAWAPTSPIREAASSPTCGTRASAVTCFHP